VKIALVHDYLTQYGGAERTLESVTKIWPEAPVYTSILNKSKLDKQGFKLQKNPIVTSFMQKFPFKNRWANSYYLPIYPMAFENFIFDDFEVVFSINSYASKAVITKPETLHISYCCTPPRHLWNFDEYVAHHDKVKKSHRIILKPVISYLRMWDLVASTRVDSYVAISEAIRKKIKNVYHRESVVIHPPVNIKKFKEKLLKPSETDYFLIVSRLGGHKRVDLAIEAFNKIPDKKLIIIGSGPMKETYQKIASPNIIFKGRLSDSEMISYYQNCLAFLYPQEEDFGITALEAQAAGKPVIGYKKGGLLDTVIEGKTGIFFEKQEVSDMIKAVTNFDLGKFSNKDCIKNAASFSEEVFLSKIKSFVFNEYERKFKAII